MPRRSIEANSVHHVNPIPTASRVGPLLMSSIIPPRNPGADDMLEVDKAIVFAEREGFRALELDLYRATGSGATSAPLIVFVHGGGWRVGHRRAPRETREWSDGFFERLCAAGFVVAAVSYRFSGEAKFPAQLDDVVDAMRWLHDHAAEVGIDRQRTYLWGASAGGMAGKSRTFAGGAGMSPPRVSIRTMADRADGYFAKQLGLITLEQTVECGISSRTRERRCASGDWDRPHPRVYRSRAYAVSHGSSRSPRRGRAARRPPRSCSRGR